MTGRIRKRQNKRTALLFLTCSAGLFIAICLLTYMFDPLQYYRKASFYKPVFSTEERYQNPGLAKNYTYNTIIIGTSMTENFVPSYVDQQLGGETKTMKLSMKGSTSGEQSLIAKLAFDTGQVHKVIWGLDYFAFKGADGETLSDMPMYMYDDSLFNDIKYLFNITNFTQIGKSIYHLATGGSANQQSDLDYLNNWHIRSKYGAELILNDWRKAKYKEQYFGLNEEPLQAIEANFNRNVLTYVKQHPETEFMFFYPPYSVLRHEVWSETNKQRYENQFAFKEYVFQQLSRYPNVKLYDFQSDEQITFNLDLYKDLSHHSQDINDRIIQAMAAHDPRYLVTAQNVHAFNDQLKHEVDTVIISDRNEAFSFDVAVDGKPAHFTTIDFKGEEEALVPAKEVAQFLGMALNWDAAAKTAELSNGDSDIKLTIQSREINVNGASLSLHYAPELKNGKTLVPLVSITKAAGGLSTLESSPFHKILNLTTSR